MNNRIQSENFVYPSSEHLNSCNSYYVNNGYQPNTINQYEQYNQPTVNTCYANNAVVSNSWHCGLDDGILSKTTNELASNNSMSFESVANIEFDLADLDYI